MALLNIALGKTLKHEGGYVNDPDDPGGETYRGISRVHHPDWRGWRIIDKEGAAVNSRTFSTNYLLQQEVVGFYQDHFWDKLLCGQMDNQDVANIVFDQAVNMGTRRTVKYLQVAVNALNRNEKAYANLVEDGICGEKTITAVNTCCNMMNGVSYLVKAINILRGAYYMGRVSKKPSQRKYIRGWLNRVEV